MISTSTHIQAPKSPRAGALGKQLATWLIMAVLCFQCVWAVVGALLGKRGLTEWYRTRCERIGVEEHILKCEKEIAVLSGRLLAFRAKRSYQEKVIRETLGYVRTGDRQVSLNEEEPPGMSNQGKR